VVSVTSVVVRSLLGLVLVGLLALGVICAMKGKWLFYVLGCFAGVFWIVGAMRLAKPNSYWAEHRYGEVEMAEALRRFSRKPFRCW
jgi:hypothetical protein